VVTDEYVGKQRTSSRALEDGYRPEPGYQCQDPGLTVLEQEAFYEAQVLKCPDDLKVPEAMT
jgi:hypothetical protein